MDYKITDMHKLKINYKLLILVFILNIQFCRQGDNKNNTSTGTETDSQKIEVKENEFLNDINSIEDVLKRQVERGAAYYYYTHYHETDFLASIPVSKALLKDNGYNFNNDFNSKIHSIFHIDNPNDSGYISVNKYTGQQENSSFIFGDDGEDPFIYILFKENFISDFLLLPVLFNYRKYFPEIAREGDIPPEDENPDGTRDYLLWKEVDDLDKQQELNIKRLVCRNKYLFNDDQSSLIWLLENDPDFLHSLVTTFGYDKEPKINKIVLENISQDYYHPWSSMLQNLFAAKDYNGELQIREALMQYIVDSATVEKSELLNMLYDCTTLLFSVYYMAGSDHAGIFDGFSQAEKLKFMAYAGYYIQLAYNKNKTGQSYRYPESFLREGLSHYKNELLEEIKKNNYYGLPDYAEIMEEVLLQRIMGYKGANTNKRTLCRILSDTVYTYKRYEIEDSIVWNNLSPGTYKYDLTDMVFTTDTIVLYLDFPEDVEKNNSVIKKTHLIKDRATYIWKIYYNDDLEHPSEYELIEDKDIIRSGYFVNRIDPWSFDISI
jgi:hypothetical protein